MKALDGVRILDLTQKLTGSLATMYLSSYGAEVERVMVECAYKETGTSTGTARILGASQSTAYRLIQKHHVQGEGKE